MSLLKKHTMPYRNDEPKYPAKKLLLVGIPAFFLAVLISTVTHEYAHFVVNKFACNGTEIGLGISYIDIPDMQSNCPLAAAAGPAWTFMLALASFGYYLHNPRNLFAAAMAFVNASSRIPETITVFLQLLVHNKTTLIVDESLSLYLFNLKDPTISIVFMCFFSITIVFLTLTIINDTKTISWKWLIALVLFIALIPLEYIILEVVAPLII